MRSRSSTLTVAVATGAVLALHSTAGAQATAAPPPAVRYDRAEQLLTWNSTRLITGDEVQPQWLKDGARFWYRNKVRQGAEFVLVDPVRGARELLFDNAKLAAAISVAADTAIDPTKLPFRTFRFAKDGDDERTIEFRFGKRRVSCDIGAYRCLSADTLPSEVPYVLSPDRKWEAFVRGYDVFVRPRGVAADSVRLTTDGAPGWSYGLGDPTPQQRLAPRPAPRRPQLRWAPNSRHLIVSRQDARGVATMPYISYTSQRPRAFSQPYALPGDSVIPKPGFAILDREARTNVRVQLDPAPAQASWNISPRDSVWNATSTRVYLTTLSRAAKVATVVEVDAATGAVKRLAADSAKTFVEIGNPVDPSPTWVTEDGETLLWSERDGWGHLYRYAADGTLKNRLTEGPWQVGTIVAVDEKAKRVWFTGRGRETDAFLYYAQLYAVNFDGTGLTRLTGEDADHRIAVSPNGRWIVDTYSRVETPPQTVLRDALSGRIVKRLEAADASQLAAVGFRGARVFTAKARDGVTDLYGVMYVPSTLDTTRRYPIISHIYPGPQVGSVGGWTYKAAGEPAAIAELGFIVVQIDHLGTPLRSKAFHDSYYGNFGDNGLPDHIAVLKQLASRFGYIDIDRVGIFGHSGGGFASTDAMLRYPDFFKVAVSGAGNHDNRSYNIYWAEKYQGLMRRDTLRRTDNFAESANAAMAANLKGHLLLMHGDMDDNVHPAMTIQLVDALIKANRSFDLIIAPNRPHSLNEPYFIRRRWDYFVQHLLGVTPPSNYLIVRPADATGTDGNTPGTEDDGAIPPG
ncbi:MAG: DPP IV N-terminal domain-containing protein [Gemmatimonadaceae bacterium]|nr:DPP IV N-terminal domain-containing protein [Gemmatimonadaceae bacterium]